MGSVLEDICNVIQIILTAFLVFFLLLKSRRVKEKTILYFMAGGVFYDECLFDSCFIDYATDSDKGGRIICPLLVTFFWQSPYHFV